MSERIKELSDQAHEFALKTINFGENFGDIWIEKLGKLIVNDCIKELEISRRCDPYTGNLYDCEYNTCIGEQIQVLEARFGVKYYEAVHVYEKNKNRGKVIDFKDLMEMNKGKEGLWMKNKEEDLVYRLRKRAEIRRQNSERKSVKEGKPDRISDLLEEAATEIERLNNIKAGIDRNTDNKEYEIGTEEGYKEFKAKRDKL